MTEQNNSLPEKPLFRHPAMESIMQAEDEFQQGLPVTARCFKCDELLRVEHLEVIGSTWVSCPNGCTRSHASGYGRPDTAGLISLKNLGSNTRLLLEKVGIRNRDDLEALGAVEVYKRLKERFPDKVRLNMVWMLQAAILGTYSNELPPDLKAELRAQVENKT